METSDCTVGFYFIGCDLWQGRLTLGTSPWMIQFYNLENVILKFQHPFSESTMSHQFAYFNSNPSLGHLYEQRSVSYWMTYLTKFEKYDLSTTFNYMYFFNEAVPFSLRREPFNNQAQQLTLSTLHQFYFSEHLVLQFELGVLGLNYAYPNLLGGASWNYSPDDHWLYQLGASFNKRFANPSAIDPNSTYIRSPENYADSSVHPEVQIQYWF